MAFLLHCLLILFALSPGPLAAQPLPAPIVQDGARIQPTRAKSAMVASQERLASEVGAAVLAKGGNAVDAAVATGFALAVTLPRAGNLGGGGFMLVHLAKDNTNIAIDYRETAPQAATPTMFLSPDGQPDTKLSRDSGLSVGVPGTVAGLALAHERFGSGRFTLAELIAPAIRLARDGFTVPDDLADSLSAILPRLSPHATTRAIFLPQGRPLQNGERLVQEDLARVLEQIAQRGPQGFYDGAAAEKIVASVKAAGGIMTLADMKGYKALLREPVRGSYRGLDIVSMPPPSSGGAHLIQILNMLEGDDIKNLGFGSASTLHLMTESMKRAYADRAAFLGDPDSVTIPLKGLLSKTYAKELRAQIRMDQATPSSDIRAGAAATHEGDQTTHFSVIDKDGNAVANTYTINFSYGLGLVAEGTGILLNNELDDFAAKAGASNAFGLTQGAANLPGPGKRPLSSMAPTILFQDGKVKMVTGSPGGSRIITITLNTILNVVDHGMNIAESVAAPRIHHQWLPDVLELERGFSPDTLALLRERGHRLAERPAFGSVSAILVTPEGLTGTGDPRQRGTFAAGD